MSEDKTSRALITGLEKRITVIEAKLSPEIGFNPMAQPGERLFTRQALKSYLKKICKILWDSQDDQMIDEAIAKVMDEK